MFSFTDYFIKLKTLSDFEDGIPITKAELSKYKGLLYCAVLDFVPNLSETVDSQNFLCKSL